MARSAVTPFDRRSEYERRLIHWWNSGGEWEGEVRPVDQKAMTAFSEIVTLARSASSDVKKTGGFALGFGTNLCDEKMSQRCRGICYACGGHSVHPVAVARNAACGFLAVEDPEGFAWRIKDELKGAGRLGEPVRYCLNGDAVPALWPFLRHSQDLGIDWYGYTRLAAAARKWSHRLILSRFEGEAWPRRADIRVAYIRGPEDPEMPTRATWPPHITLPLHSRGKRAEDVPTARKDCPAVRHRVETCYQCRRCFARGEE